MLCFCVDPSTNHEPWKDIIDVDGEQFKTADVGTQLGTYGLATCIGVLLRGASADGSVLRVGVCHDVVRSEQLMQEFVADLVSSSAIRSVEVLMAGGMALTSVDAQSEAHDLSRYMHRACSMLGVQYRLGQCIIGLQNHPAHDIKRFPVVAVERMAEVYKIPERIVDLHADRHGRAVAVKLDAQGVPWIAFT